MKQKLLSEDESVETVVVRQKPGQGSKLKRKIVYVYDSDSDEDEKQKPVAGRPTIIRSQRSQQPDTFFAKPVSQGFKAY